MQLMLLQIDQGWLCRNCAEVRFVMTDAVSFDIVAGGPGVAVQSVRAVDQAVINAGGF